MQIREGGTDTFRVGSLIRRLKPVRLANIGAAGVTTAQTFKVIVQGLTSTLTVHIAVGLVKTPTSSSNNQDPILPSAYPATPGTMQLIPIVNNPEAPKLYLREVFQDPTATDNTNQPLPQDIPFGWSFESEGADQVQVDVVIPSGAYTATSISGALICAVTVEYTGPWITAEAFENAIGQVRIVGVPDAIAISSAGG